MKKWEIQLCTFVILSDNLIKNFEMAMNDIGSKGIQTLINEFWTNEQNELKQKTCLKS